MYVRMCGSTYKFELSRGSMMRCRMMGGGNGLTCEVEMADIAGRSAENSELVV